MKAIYTVTQEHGDELGNMHEKKAVVLWDEEWEEFRTRFYKDGKHLKKADSHTDDRQDAEQTARHWVNQRWS
jgi:putative SOS response-associated peptidase YedK